MNIKFKNRIGTCVAVTWLLVALNVHAHIVLEQKSATAGSYHKATFMVGHGCDGSPTTAIEIEMPEPMAVVKPMPKHGWLVTTTTAPLATPMSLHGRPITETLSRVVWRGGPLPDSHYDEFVVLLQLPNRAGRLYFKVAQYCENGRSDWTEIPATGQTGRLKLPAPMLDVLPPAKPHQH